MSGGRSATAAGTAAYREALAREVPASHFRPLDGLLVSSIGLGTYLGEEDDETDRRYGAALVDAANLGCNLFDTAINYRAQRSERVLGQALAALVREGGFPREQIVVCTKGGYIPFDGSVPPDPSAYVRD
ncbi:MAG: aldo/keto reductase, partial [Deltaproteobacteria bacterium]